MRPFFRGSSRSGRRAWLLAISLPFGVAAALGATSPSSASPGLQPPTRSLSGGLSRPLGIVPNQVAAMSQKAVTGPMTYHQGYVQHGATEYAIFWAPPGYYLSPAYRGLVDNYFTDIAAASFTAGNVYSVSTQYYDTSGPGGSRKFISNWIAFGGQIIDHNAYPSAGRCPLYTLADGHTTAVCITDLQITNEIDKLVTALKLPRGLGAQYFVYLPYSVGECFTAGAGAGNCYDPVGPGFCAYHYFFGINTPTLYAVMPYNNLTNCTAMNNTQVAEYPNASDADPAISTTSHELSETLTDPTGTGWYFQTHSGEIGDQCAYVFGTPVGNGFYSPNGAFNQAINGDIYWTQEEWSNQNNTCVQRTTNPQPSATFGTSPRPTHGHPTTFTAVVHDSDDVSFTYKWSFGDGATTTLSKPSHTYARAGSYSVTLVVTDAHGDAVRVIKPVSVA